MERSSTELTSIQGKMTQSNEPKDTRLSPAILERLAIEACFHKVISDLCGGRLDYIHDITAEDLITKTDANGDCIPPAVARGLVRKLQSHKDQKVLNTEESERAPEQEENVVERCLANPKKIFSPDSVPCSLTLTRGNGDFSALLRCSVKGTIRKTTAAPTRRKVLTAVLDNSGSMRGHWPLVVDAITKVFTDNLLNDPCVSLKAVAYNTKAEQVMLPCTASELSSLLIHKYSPGGITNFKAAFELAEELIREEVNRLHNIDEITTSEIDVMTLIFTDGADTSVAPLGYVSDAATAKAKKAGDAFRDFTKSMGCSSYTCVAAFGEYHNPAQCQSLGDRYYYINRREVLSDWLMGGLSDLLRSSGSCSLSVQLPSRLGLLEAIPNTIQLDSRGDFGYEIWLQDKAAGSATVDGDEIKVCIKEASGNVAASGNVSLSSSVVAYTECLQGWLFLLDAGEMQLRQIALELRGRRPSPTELAMLRERLVGVQALLQPIADKARDPKARVAGRSLVLSRVEELETRRTRLSYTLGHFEVEDHGDTRKIGAVGIDAVLRDVSQRVPLRPEAARHARKAERAAAMPSAKTLSRYGAECTFDPLSNCNAKQAADQGDALFFCVSGLSLSHDGGISSAADFLGAPVVAHDAFMLLSSKRGVSTPTSIDISEAQLGIPVYATAGHFNRATLILPEVLERLSGSSYESGKSERLLLDLLGHSLAAHLKKKPEESQDSFLALMHKARSAHAVFKLTKSLSGASCLLDDVLSEAKTFMDDAETRKGTRNLHGMAAVGLLAQEWPLGEIKRLGEALIGESMRRAIEHRLAGKSKTSKIQLAWALLGSGEGKDGWLGHPLDNNSKGNGEEAQWTKGFDILRVGPEMEELERTSPDRPCPRDPGILSDVLCSPLLRGTLRAKEWFALRTLFSQWGGVVDAEKTNGGLWYVLDKIMVDDCEECMEALARIRAAVRPRREAMTLGEVLPDPTTTLSSFARECLRGMSSQQAEPRGSVRLELASVAESLVKEREKLARDHPIVGASPPSLPFRPTPTEKDLHDVWGSQARPVNKVLYNSVRRNVHREKFDCPLTVREALTDKRYRKRGGVFEFPTRLDTFIPGLHRRTQDLHEAWRSRGRQTRGVEARRDAAAEMLLRLPWDDRDDVARRKLTAIVGAIWDGLNGVPPPSKPLASALWIDDDVDESDGAAAASTDEGESGGGENGEGWDVL